ncbi:DUF2459 domain-containing protein [Labrys sp. KNU-23]|uniref:DUF2459 domain-containing protein n=1 Tax=Labrys sp. KNU-23 TaxID=2789216 RepID=UPI0011EFF409|nr:DUF2459 domain-containing protein [Labrys sp. KNU-23]QEN89272.1 DUF2459 domain-containing protein [Labrys sp. KNU-23]
MPDSAGGLAAGTAGRTRLSQSLRLILALTAVPLLALLLFMLAAIGFALLPAAGRAQQAGGEPTLYLCASLAHTDIVMPSRDVLIDWTQLFPAVTPPDLPAEAYLAFGWGDLVFFQDTPTWADTRVSTALAALAGRHDTALRVVAVNPPVANPDCLPLSIDQEGRQALIAHIRASLQPDAAGRAQQRPGGTGLEAFYLAKGRYGPFNTCNQWAAEALAAAGLPHAHFAPFSFSVTWPLTKGGAG